MGAILLLNVYTTTYMIYKLHIMYMNL